MRFRVRKPSLRGRVSARTSWKRVVRHQMGLKAPRGWGLFTNPKKAIYNRVYNRTTVSIDDLAKPRRSRSSDSGIGFRDLLISEGVVIGLASCAIMAGLLMWIGFSLKWALIVTALAGVGALFG